MKDEIKKTSIGMSPAKFAKIKTIAENEKRTISDAINEAIDHWLDTVHGDKPIVVKSTDTSGGKRVIEIPADIVQDARDTVDGIEAAIDGQLYKWLAAGRKVESVYTRALDHFAGNALTPVEPMKELEDKSDMTTPVEPTSVNNKESVQVETTPIPPTESESEPTLEPETAPIETVLEPSEKDNPSRLDVIRQGIQRRIKIRHR